MSLLTDTVRLPRLRVRIRALVWTRGLVALGVALVLALGVFGLLRLGVAVGLVLVGFLVMAATNAWEQSLRRQFVRDARMPRHLVTALLDAHPELRHPRDAELVLRGLRQFFMAHLRSRRQFVSMPSKVVDTAWHSFILDTQAYAAWCRAAFGGMLHHTPAAVLGSDPKRNDGLRRSWYWSCREESIDPRRPSRLPLLFALDRKFAIPGGFVYEPDCKSIDQASGAPVYCGTSFSESSGASGDASGFGGLEVSASSDGDGSSCGGGCGGGD